MQIKDIKNAEHPFWKWAMHSTYLLAALGSLYLFSSYVRRRRN